MNVVMIVRDPVLHTHSGFLYLGFKLLGWLAAAAKRTSCAYDTINMHTVSILGQPVIITDILMSGVLAGWVCA